MVNQLSAIDKNKFNPYLLTLFSEQKDSFSGQVNLDNKRWKRLNFRSLFDFMEWLRLFKFLKKEKFDAVITSLFSANLIVRTAAILAGIPVIVSYEHNIYPDKHRWQIIADKILSYWTDKIIVDSDAARVFTAKQENIPLEKFLLLYIPPLLDMSRAKPGSETSVASQIAPQGGASRSSTSWKNPNTVRRELKIPEDAKVVLTVSRLVEEKGHKYLIEAAKKVLEKFPDTYFVIVGWGPLENSLKSQVRSLKLEDRVLLPGKMDIRDVLPLADVYVDPAVWTDLPIAIMEALQLKKPVVASNICEIPVFVRDMENGFLVEPKDAEGLAQKINLLLENEPLRKEMGERGGGIVESFSLKKYMENFQNLIIDFYKKYENGQK